MSLFLTGKKFIRSLTPSLVLQSYHTVLSYGSHALFGFPANNLLVIGITGTKGKTTTSNYIWSVLNHAGIKTGIISTANIRIGDEQSLNYYHMTMPGRTAIARLMNSMVKAGCKVCVVETTSEGLKQERHRGISYDIAVFTNLTPEHLPSHGGSFEKYKQTKGKLFSSLKKTRYKKLSVFNTVGTTIIVNSDSEHAPYYLSFEAHNKYTYGLHSGEYQARNIVSSWKGTKFDVNGHEYTTHLIGAFNVYNILPALIIGKILGIEPTAIDTGLKSLTTIPGRMEIITKPTDPFQIIVDYAHENQSMNALLESARTLKDNDQTHGKIIVLLGAEGGGRDPRKRFEMGETVAKKADIAIVTNVDPYDDNPQSIIEDIAQTAEKFGMKRSQNLFTIEDRRQAIEFAINLAQKNDIILITGKGAEQSMIIKGKTIPWDDRTIVHEIISQKFNH